ncbi:MAG TPA: hypothetical protein VEJ84_06500 [Acidimicrobiales bacterium]|nr:hypothetical protein [Acidimicrobiales bacterium]
MGPVSAEARFDKRRLRPGASLNRLVVSEHIGAPPEIVGKEAGSLLSAAAVRTLGTARGLCLAQSAMADDLGRAYGSEVPAGAKWQLGLRQKSGSVWHSSWLPFTLPAPQAIKAGAPRCRESRLGLAVRQRGCRLGLLVERIQEADGFLL